MRKITKKKKIVCTNCDKRYTIIYSIDPEEADNDIEVCPFCGEEMDILVDEDNGYDYRDDE